MPTALPPFLWLCIALADKSGATHWLLVRTIPQYARYVRDNTLLLQNAFTRETNYSSKTIKRNLPNGEFHCTRRGIDNLTLPAIISADGSKSWYRNGQLHRDDKDAVGLTLPAVISAYGSKWWYRNGYLHRDEKDADGLTLPAVIYEDGSKFWYRNGQLHRDGCHTDGLTLPAVISAYGRKEWWENGKYGCSKEW